MIEGVCPDCGGYLYEDTTRGEYIGYQDGRKENAHD
nr:MAG TPA: zinc ribbon domain protein [Caudoviricetes sp.]